MKGAIEQWLRTDSHWKEFIKEKAKDIVLIDIDVITLERKDENINFDVSIIYQSKKEGQKQSIESGVAIFSTAGILTKVNV